MAELKCNEALIPLRDTIKGEIKDEDASYKKYSELADKLDGLGETGKAEKLRLLAGQELLHGVILQDMVDVITERCEEPK